MVDAGMVTVFLCRHIETEDIVEDRYHSRKESVITADGEGQLRLLRQAFRFAGVDSVYSSPAGRARITAKAIASNLGLPVELLPFLLEWEPGQWEGLTRKEVQQAFAQEYDGWITDPASNAPRQGESLYQVAARVVKPLQDTLAMHDGGAVVIVAHNTVNRVILSHALGVPLKECRKRLRQDPGGVTKLHYSPASGWQLGSQLISPLGSGEACSDQTSSSSATLSVSQFADRIGTVQRRLSPIWPEGRDPAFPHEGHHWTLPGHDRPVSVGRVEAYFLFNVAALLKPRVTVEIGTGFGYSTLWLAGGMLSARSGDPTLFSIDNHQEGALGYEAVRFARKAVSEVGVAEIVMFVHGNSPSAVEALEVHRDVDLAFIDGNHHGDQPLQDFEGIDRHASESAVILWHDVDERYEVPKAFLQATSRGWQGRIFSTSCKLAATYKQDSALPLILSAMEAAERHKLMAGPTETL